MAHVLVVSDASWVVNDVQSALTDSRFEIRSLDDPAAAPEAATAESTDVVIIDLQVGSMGGMAITRAVRDAADAASLPRPPIVLLLDRDADGFLAGRSGADGWLRKPFTADALRATIDGLLTAAPEQS